MSVLPSPDIHVPNLCPCFCFRYSQLVRSFAWFITAIQILQMVVGMVVLSHAARVQLVEKGDCFVDEANWKLGLLM